MSDNRKIRRRQRCPECGSLDVIKWGVRTRTQSFKCGISSLSIVADLQSAGYYLQRRSQPRRSRPLSPTTFVIVTNQKWQLCPFGKTPSNATGNACDELRGGMDDAGKSSAPSIPWPGRTPRQASCYGRCFARSVAPDAALRLQYATCRTERTELRMQSSIPPRRLAARGCERAMRSIDRAQRNLRGGILLCIATIINNFCRKERPGNCS